MIRFRYQLLITLFIQGFGAVAVFLSAVLLGFFLGPEQQGIFSRIRSEVEFVNALSVLGLQQSVFYFSATGRLAFGSSLRWIALMSITAAVVAAIYLFVVGGAGNEFSILFAMLSICMVLHGNLRLLVLAHSTTQWFSFVTVIPQLLVFSGVIFLVVARSVLDWEIVLTLLVAFMSSSAVSFLVLRRSNTGKLFTSEVPVGFVEMATYGLAAGIWALLSKASIFFWMRQIEFEAGLADVGVWAMCLLVVQIFLTPFQYASPLVFKVMASSSAPLRLRKNTVALSLIVMLSTGALALLLSHVVAVAGVHLGAYYPLLDLAWLLIAMVMCELLVVSLATIANASGNSWIPALSEGARFSVLFLASLVGDWSILPFAAMVWLLASACAMVTALFAVLSTMYFKGTKDESL